MSAEKLPEADRRAHRPATPTIDGRSLIPKPIFNITTASRMATMISSSVTR